MGLVLRPGGSAAGVDGLPYEVYQVSPAGVSCLVAQAVLAGEHGSWAVRHVIGDEPDLLIWAPKPHAHQEAAASSGDPRDADAPFGTMKGYRAGAARPGSCKGGACSAIIIVGRSGREAAGPQPTWPTC